MNFSFNICCCLCRLFYSTKTLKYTQQTHPPFVSIPFFGTFISAVLQFIIMAELCFLLFFCLIQIASDFFWLLHYAWHNISNYVYLTNELRSDFITKNPFSPPKKENGKTFLSRARRLCIYSIIISFNRIFIFTIPSVFPHEIYIFMNNSSEERNRWRWLQL
jgi:hypothetical protein